MGYLILGAIIGVFLGAIVVYIYFNKKLRIVQGETKELIERAEKEAERIIEQANIESKNIIKQAQLEAKEEILKEKEKLEKEYKAQKKELELLQEKLDKKEENIEKKNEILIIKEAKINEKEAVLLQLEQELATKEKELKQKVEEIDKLLEKISGMSKKEALDMLTQKLISEAQQQALKEIKQIEDKAKEESEEKAKWIIGVALQRYAGEYVQEVSVTSVNLPSDEMKGRIIGREGRNIRALESICGVDLIIDDTPETVVISSFDPIRREVARIALERLIQDGRIHPGRIEEVVEKARKEVEKSIKEAGEQAVVELGVGRMHPELIRYIGKLKYRYSYSQNVLYHSIEAAHIAGLIAAELNLPIKQAKRATLLHDIGKAVSHEVEGSHAIVGANLAKKFGEHELIVNAIAAHHEEEQPLSPLAFIVAASDAISGARPGARRELMESYLKRLEELERICMSFEGVEKSYAIQAGREVRVLVENTKVSDEAARQLAKEIARKIERELTYPGQIKVTVIRETRVIEYAK